jgi:hypothetical protein
MTVTTLPLNDPEQFPPLTLPDKKYIVEAETIITSTKQATNDTNKTSLKTANAAKPPVGDITKPKPTNEKASTMEIDNNPVTKNTSTGTTIDKEDSNDSGILHCAPQSSGQVPYSRFYYRKPPVHAPQKPKEELDKPIMLKQGQKRNHVHRYDMRFSVKKAKDEDAELTVIKAALQKFFELLLQADASIIIPPFYEIERSDKAASDLSSKFQVSELESLVALKRYFARLSKITDKGFVYCNVIIAHSSSFLEIMDKLRQIFNDLKFGLYPRASDNEDSAGRVAIILQQISRLPTISPYAIIPGQ